MRYTRDPYWITAKFGSQCQCGKPISKGDTAFYYPNSRKAVCENCGREGASYLEDEKINEQLHVC